LREEQKICCQKLQDEQFLEWNLSLSNHLKSFLNSVTGQENDLLFQLQQTTELIQRTFKIFGETIYPNHKTLEGRDMSVIFLGTVSKVVSLLLETKKEIDQNTLWGDIRSPREDEEGNHGNGGRRRWSMTHTKSSRSIDQTFENTPPPPPPPPPPKLQEPFSTSSESEHVESMTMSTPSPVQLEIPSSNPPPLVEGSDSSSYASTPTLSDPSETTDTKSTKSSKDKTKGEKSSRSSRSKARIATL
jgi:hypothetical protein